MAHSLNLMTERSLFRAAAQRSARAWALIIGVMVVLATPFAAWTWQRRQHLVGQLEALEASYEPVRRLTTANLTLNAQAARLVDRERLPLQLARRQPLTALLAIVNEAIADTRGAVFVQHMTVTQDANAPGDDGAGRLILSVTTSLGYEASKLTEALSRPPFDAAKITSSETVADGGLARTNHVIECAF